jgi:sec-independent protein translocase protein TatA
MEYVAVDPRFADDAEIKESIMLHMPSFPEMLIIMAVGLILFGKRLPEVGKNLGKGIVEFKKGLKGIEEELDMSSNSTTSSATPRPPLQTRLPDQPTQPVPTTPAYKFDPYTGKPVDQTTTQSTGV